MAAAVSLGVGTIGKVFAVKNKGKYQGCRIRCFEILFLENFASTRFTAGQIWSERGFKKDYNDKLPSDLYNR